MQKGSGTGKGTSSRAGWRAGSGTGDTDTEGTKAGEKGDFLVGGTRSIATFIYTTTIFRPKELNNAVIVKVISNCLFGFSPIGCPLRSVAPSNLLIPAYLMSLTNLSLQLL